MKNNIKNILNIKKITQKQLAEMTGITESAICRYVKQERMPCGENLLKIAEALDVEANELLSNGIKRLKVFELASTKINNIRLKIKLVQGLLRKLNQKNPVVKEIQELLRKI